MKKIYPIVMIVSGILIPCLIGCSLTTHTSDRIESSAKKSYVFKTHLKDDNIKIKATDAGVVVLTGTVSQWSHQRLAEETVSGLPEVKRVENKLTIENGLMAESSDEWIGIKVKTILLFHKNVSGTKIKVDVKDSVVHLSGQVQSEAEKDLASEYAGDVENVKSVKNELTIKKAEKAVMDKVGDFIDDASITAQVKVALLFHRSTSVIKTKVTTKKGIVTVGGIVKNEAEKDLVGKLTNDIMGVKGLKNEITIE